MKKKTKWYADVNNESLEVDMGAHESRIRACLTRLVNTIVLSQTSRTRRCLSRQVEHRSFERVRQRILPFYISNPKITYIYDYGERKVYLQTMLKQKRPYNTS